MRGLQVAALLALASCFCSPSVGGEPAKLKAGEKAPDFSLKDEKGKEVKLSSFLGKKNVLIAFYPKDFTGG